MNHASISINADEYYNKQLHEFIDGLICSDDCESSKKILSRLYDIEEIIDLSSFSEEVFIDNERIYWDIANLMIENDKNKTIGYCDENIRCIDCKDKEECMCELASDQLPSDLYDSDYSAVCYAICEQIINNDVYCEVIDNGFYFETILDIFGSRNSHYMWELTKNNSTADSGSVFVNHAQQFMFPELLHDDTACTIVKFGKNFIMYDRYELEKDNIRTYHLGGSKNE